MKRVLLDVDSKKQLLIDQRFIEDSEGIVLTVNEARKHPEPVLVADRPWESMCIGGYFTVREEAGRFRLWYDTFASDYRDDYDDRLCYADSNDGLHWEKPGLGLIEFQGSKDNNIVFEDRSGFGYHGGTVFTDPSAPPSERYKTLYQARGGTRADQWHTCMRGAYSEDGVHWHKYSGLLADHLSDTQTVVYYDEGLRRYIGYFRLWTKTGRRAVGRSETHDFQQWPRNPALVLAPDDTDPADMHMYTNGYHIYHGAADTHFFIITSFYKETDCTDIQLATSRDGINWNRVDRRPFIRLGVEGDWDSRQIYVGAAVIPMGDEVWVYYTGYRHRHGEAYPNVVSYGGKIGVAKVRRDGFISADAGYEGGYFTTPLLRFSGSRLELNYDAGAGGFIAVEILGENGYPLKGFSRTECNLLRGSSTAQTVTWHGGNDISSLANTPIHLRFTMRDSRLYAFQFL